MTIILPCPFCGSTDTFVGECEHVEAGCSTFWVECDGCSARGSVSEYKEGAIQYWNKPEEKAVALRRPPLQKRPVIFRVKDHADSWIYLDDEALAQAEADRTGALMQGLYVRDGT